MSAEAIELTKAKEACRDLAQACQARAKERDEYWGDRLLLQVLDDERRSEIAHMLGMSHQDCSTPDWQRIMIRLNECLTTYRRRISLIPQAD